MLQIMILLIFILVIIIGVLGGYKKNMLIGLMNISFIGMLIFLLLYFLKVSGALPIDAMILYGSDVLSKLIVGISIQLNTIALWENFFRFIVVYLFFAQSVHTNLSASKLFAKHKYLYIVTALPLILVYAYSTPSIMYAKFAYKYDFQAFIVNISYWLILAYVVASFVLLFAEYRLIALSWHKKRHFTMICQMALFCIPYLMFAQLDPVNIYQDYMRICVFTDPIMLSQGGSLWIWYTAFFICMLSLISMIVSSVFILKSDYDNIKKELSITQRVSSAEFTASMLLHGLKNQLLSANILAKKLATGLDAEEADKDKLVETAHKLYEINTEMSEKLSYLYKSVDSVKTVLKKISVDEFSKMLKTKVAIKDTSSIVSYAITDGYIMADAELLSEALVNIISNAIEAVEKINSRKLVIVRISFTRNHALITIIDNGMGMKDDMKDKIFMPFTSSKNSTTNWGLGLCYARRIIKQHRGDIRFTSKEGKGTTFYITLPMVGSKGEK